MTPADSYRIRAAELMASACWCPTRAQRLELEPSWTQLSPVLARSYLADVKLRAGV